MAHSTRPFRLQTSSNSVAVVIVVMVAVTVIVLMVVTPLPVVALIILVQIAVRTLCMVRHNDPLLVIDAIVMVPAVIAVVHRVVNPIAVLGATHCGKRQSKYTSQQECSETAANFIHIGPFQSPRLFRM